MHKLGYQVPNLEVRESNMPAINLYKKLASLWLEYGRFYTRPQENAIIMWRREMQ